MQFIKSKILKWRTNKDHIKIKQSRLMEILKTQLPEHKSFPLDGHYFIPQHNHLEKAIKRTKIDRIQWVKNKFDCENHALYLHSTLALDYNINACGIVISYESAHAFNIILSYTNGNIKVRKLEPQTDELWKPESPERNKYVTKGEIILI